MGWLMPNQFITHTWEGDNPDLWENIKNFNDSAQKSATSGFAFGTSNVATEITSVQNVYEEYQMSIEYGFVDPVTAIPEMNDKMMEAGLDKIIEEKQTQLDEWVTGICYRYFFDFRHHHLFPRFHLSASLDSESIEWFQPELAASIPLAYKFIIDYAACEEEELCCCEFVQLCYVLTHNRRIGA